MDSASGKESSQLHIGKWRWGQTELHSSSLDASGDGDKTVLHNSPEEVLSSSDETCCATSVPSLYIESHNLTRVSLMRNDRAKGSEHETPERRKSANNKNRMHPAYISSTPPEIRKSVSDAFDPFATYPSEFPPDLVNRCNAYRKYHRETYFAVDTADNHR
jgi:hypothetical protein